ncbi:response regulator [Pseudoduganella sp. SL102]|uniref:response regulator n=1 Tax=Pseudoduganella sp. SL102 TaxID=2995154 RepID=UPI00248C8285|nr:response regulator [Pseudoduganella sp. SL102]WBS00096.1 response regulator [Pseudoduganella sp. SL102]
MTSSKRILIVDDNVDAADLTAEILRLYGLEVNVAYGGPEGLAAAKATAPSTIFLDIGMPVMDGYQVAMALRSDEAFHRVKIVALTAWNDAAAREKSKAAGFDRHFIKPADFRDLLDVAQ